MASPKIRSEQLELDSEECARIYLKQVILTTLCFGFVASRFHCAGIIRWSFIRQPKT